MSREQFWFFHPFRVRYSEIDGQGVVFNAHYLTYFDTTITEYFRALGYDQYADAKQTGEDFHVVKSVIEYKAPVRFDWELDVGARVARIGNSSMTFELAIFLKGGSDALVTWRDHLGQHQPGNPPSGPDIEGDPGADRGAGETSGDVRAALPERDPVSTRHCERSEAIHRSAGAEAWIASSLCSSQ
ncbi:acyl-CoA thioesterase [Bradyrhizobium valentinum]|uniref:acyl-CoA thioesterase n=1 Tax=Bradyrhizobium valentinum TaxID=1518501 RepID=UPI000AAAB75E|nr:thioesterase family protein [Bradyrhizobium valentinum]